jgi:hypothetical protein
MAHDEVLDTDYVRDALLDKIEPDMAELYLTKDEVEAARVGETSLLVKQQQQDLAITAAIAGSGCWVSANDTNTGYLNGKLIEGDGIDLTENNDGGNETLTIDTSLVDALLLGCM